MFVESLDSIPEELRDQFVKVEVDGKEGYRDKDSNDLRNHLFNVKNENKDVKSKLAEFETAKAAEIEAARQKALEEAKKSGDAEKIREQYQQQLDDANARMESLQTSINNKSIDAAITELAEIATTEGKAAFKTLVRTQIKVGDQGELIYLNGDGGATSLDTKGFIDELKKQDLFKPLIKAQNNVNGGGFANGSSNSGGASTGKLDGSKSERTKYFAEKFNLNS